VKKQNAKPDTTRGVTSVREAVRYHPERKRKECAIRMKGEGRAAKPLGGESERKKISGGGGTGGEVKIF